jgi:hypothetical protein
MLVLCKVACVSLAESRAVVKNVERKSSCGKSFHGFGKIMAPSIMTPSSIKLTSQYQGAHHG